MERRNVAAIAAAFAAGVAGGALGNELLVEQPAESAPAPDVAEAAEQTSEAEARAQVRAAADEEPVAHAAALARAAALERAQGTLAACLAGTSGDCRAELEALAAAEAAHREAHEAYLRARARVEFSTAVWRTKAGGP